MFSYYHPITVRYRDLDPQGHVNNTVYLTYLESARLGYYQRVGFYHPGPDALTGLVVVRNEIDYLAPILLGDELSVGLRVERLGTKSITFAFQMASPSEERLLAQGKSVMVVYDNNTQKGVPIPPTWREDIIQFEKENGNNDLT